MWFLGLHHGNRIMIASTEVHQRTEQVVLRVEVLPRVWVLVDRRAVVAAIRLSS